MQIEKRQEMDITVTKNPSFTPSYSILPGSTFISITLTKGTRNNKII